QQVRTREVDLLLALVGDRVRRRDQLHVPAREGVLTVGALGLDPLDLVGLVAELLGDVGGDVHVEAGEGTVRLLQAQAGLVVLDADLDLAAAPGGRRTAVVAVVAAARGGGEGKGEYGGRGGSDLAELHGAHPLAVKWCGPVGVSGDASRRGAGCAVSDAGSSTGSPWHGRCAGC